MIVGTPTKLNLIPSGVMPVVYINKGDAGYDKEFLIYNGDTPYNVPSGVSATIRGTKADNYGVTEAAEVTTGTNLVTVTITEQMVAAAGENLYELVFVDTNDLRVASINMVWAVKKDALGDSVISDSDLDYATTVMNTLQSVQAFKNQLDTNTDGLAAETAARIAADNTLQSNITAEASARSDRDTLLQAEIDQLIAPSGSAPSAAEVQNARIGADGVTYSTLGDAIRTQVSNLSIHRITSVPTSEMFEKGGWSSGAKSTWRQANRARLNAQYYFLCDINVSLKSRGNALIYVEYYDHKGTYLSNSGWVTQVAIQKGTIATLTLSMSNTGTAEETALNDILNSFVFLDVTPEVACDASNIEFKSGLITTSNAIGYFNDTRIYESQYITVDKRLVCLNIASGYKAYVITYDASFDQITYGYLGGWLTGIKWIDFKDAKYFRVILAKANDATIAASDSANISILRYPEILTQNIISIAKDGINDGNADYAPKYPKSSIVSFQKAVDQGFRAIELHVQFTSDLVPVVLHEQTINSCARNPDGAEISGSVSISGSTIAQLDQYDFGILFGSEYAGTKITRFSDALQFCKNHGLAAYIEPTVTLSESNETTVCNMLKAYGLQHNCAYFAYDGPVLARVKTKLPYASLYLWRNNDAQMSSGISYAVANIKTNNNKVYWYTYSDTEIQESTISAMANADIGLIIQYRSGSEPTIITSELNAYATAAVSQIVPTGSVLDTTNI